MELAAGALFGKTGDGGGPEKVARASGTRPEAAGDFIECEHTLVGI